MTREELKDERNQIRSRALVEVEKLVELLSELQASYDREDIGVKRSAIHPATALNCMQRQVLGLKKGLKNLA